MIKQSDMVFRHKQADMARWVPGLFFFFKKIRNNWKCKVNYKVCMTRWILYAWILKKILNYSKCVVYFCKALNIYERSFDFQRKFAKYSYNIESRNILLLGFQTERLSVKFSASYSYRTRCKNRFWSKFSTAKPINNSGQVFFIN